jgi:ABC-2 type transport system ATP-binding protein
MGVITVDHLRKAYRRVVAVDDLSFDVEAGGWSRSTPRSG